MEAVACMFPRLMVAPLMPFHRGLTPPSEEKNILCFSRRCLTMDRDAFIARHGPGRGT